MCECLLLWQSLAIGLFTWKSWALKEGRPKTPCLFVLLCAMAPSGLCWSDGPHVHTWGGREGPDPAEQSSELCGRAWCFCSRAPLPCKLKEHVSAWCLSSLGKQKPFNMTWKQSRSLWFWQNLENLGLISKIREHCRLLGFLGNLISSYCCLSIISRRRVPFFQETTSSADVNQWSSIKSMDLCQLHHWECELVHTAHNRGGNAFSFQRQLANIKGHMCSKDEV